MSGASSRAEEVGRSAARLRERERGEIGGDWKEVVAVVLEPLKRHIVLSEKKDMVDDLRLRMDELVNNPTARVPVCLCLDTSFSMVGEPITELNHGVYSFISELCADEVNQYSSEVAVVSFGGAATTVVDFPPISRLTIPPMTAVGETPMGAGVLLALSLLENRKREYAEAGVDYHQPCLVLMTDGNPTDSIDSAVARTTAPPASAKVDGYSDWHWPLGRYGNPGAVLPQSRRLPAARPQLQGVL